MENKIVKALLIILAAITVTVLIVAFASGLFFGEGEIGYIYVDTDIGVPYAELYGEDMLNSRLAYDMAVYGGRLYVGGGDYNANTGPVYIMSYSVHGNIWTKAEDAVPDEQIKRFRVLGEKLVTLGTDPRGEWAYGNYYVLENGVWETKHVLPSAIHCFDAIEFGGKTFFGIGCKSGDYPVVVCEEDIYTSVPFTKDGTMLDTSGMSAVRVYNLFEYQGTLYAFLTFDGKDEQGKHAGYFMDLYAYDGKDFAYVSGTLLSEDMPDVITTDTAAYFILNNTLLKTENLLNYFGISLGEGVKASDIIEDNGVIYVLAWREAEDGAFDIMVFEGDGEEFNKKFGFPAHASAGSFCKDGERFFISLGQLDQTESELDVGRVIEINRVTYKIPSPAQEKFDAFCNFIITIPKRIGTLFTKE